ncbi:MAG: SDR family oxidoreductase [Solirubrobacterales bacterium]
MKTLVTGATGFVGSHVARALAARGDELKLLVRDPERAAHLADLRFELTTGDVTDGESVRRAMSGVDRVFHVAGTTSHAARDREKVFEVNAGGTRTLSEEALRAGVERFVHTSSIAAVGPAEPGKTADESQAFRAGGLGIAYMNSKHEAEMEVLRTAAKGLQVVIVNPAFVLGPDDPSGTSNELVRRLLTRQIPVYVDGAVNVVDVRDVAAGHLLADTRGRPGERYILGGENFTLRELLSEIGEIAGVPVPPMKMPGQLAAGAMAALERAGLPTPASEDEVKAGSLWFTYRIDKARRELGFDPRPSEETLTDTVRWQQQHLEEDGARERATDAALRAGGAVTSAAGRVPGLFRRGGDG